MIDYLIVGSGLAGIAFAETALKHQKSFMVIDADLYQSSKVAAGLYNPVVLKRFTALANASEHLKIMDAFYTNLDQKLGCQSYHKLPLLRKLATVEEQNEWFVAADKPTLTNFLSANLVHQTYSGIDSPFGFGQVNHTGYVDTVQLLETYQHWLTQNQLLLREVFDYSQLVLRDDNIEYKSIQAKHIVFAEGFGMQNNPYFRDLPLEGAKGELLVIKAPGLGLDVALNSSVFILPLGDELFKVGATYNWTDKTENPTHEAKQELIDKLKDIVSCDFEIVSHKAGIRPTVKDRKSLLGTHGAHPRIHILNGLGTRGVMLAPSMAQTLFEHIELGKPLPKEIDISRFGKKQ